MKQLYSTFIILLTGAFLSQALGQQAETTGTNSYNLQDCINYALENQNQVKNARLDEKASEQKVKETVGLGLPQIEGTMQAVDNLKIQSQFVPGDAFAQPGANIDPTDVQAFAFGVDYMNDAKITANQLLFDGSYFVGLKAAKTYKELSVKTTQQTKRDVVEAVTKAYYTVLLNEVGVEMLESQKTVLEQLLKETRALYENGYNEKIDLQRVQVNLNNINIQLNTFYNNRALAYMLLKFQMSYPQSDDLGVEGNLESEFEKISTESIQDQPDYNRRIDYQLLRTQKSLNELETRNNKVAYLPKLYAFGTVGANTGTLTAGDLVDFDNYRSYALIGLNLTVPIFSGFRNKYIINQSQIETDKTANNIKQLENSIDYEYAQKRLRLMDQLETINFQKENMELASEVYRVTNIKYREGLVSNFETVSTKQEMTEAENSYYSALYETLVAYVEFKKANGTLYNENEQ